MTCPDCARLRDLVERLTADLARCQGITLAEEHARLGTTP